MGRSRDGTPRRARVAVLSLDDHPEPGQRGVPMVDRLALAEALDRLPPRMGAVVALHHVCGLTVYETAEAVGRSPNTVKSQLREALARLRVELSDEAPLGRRSVRAIPEEPS